MRIIILDKLTATHTNSYILYVKNFNSILILTYLTSKFELNN